jgi:hypothetical protein
MSSMASNPEGTTSASEMIMKALVRNSAVTAALIVVLVSASAFCQQTHGVEEPSATRVDQGCVNQGSDRREFAPVVCWLQQHLSWKSEHEPHFAVVGKAEKSHVGLAWPPYMVINSRGGSGQWRIFRIGFRYDRTWRGYIFPTMAAKRISHPLSY